MTPGDQRIADVDPVLAGGAAGPSPFLSIVTPALNEEVNVRPMVRRLKHVLAELTDSFEIIFVSDGSDDRTCDIVKELHLDDARVKLLHLSRSFGHQQAIMAGLDHSAGRVTITMDADLQHPPEAIPDLVRSWEEGADVVHAVRRNPNRGGIVTRRCKRLAYALLGRLSEVDIVPQSADFRLYDRRALLALRTMREHNRFTRGLARWIGFSQTIVHYDESERHAGVAKYSFVQQLRLLMDGVFSLSSKPLQYLGVAGLGVSMLSGLYLAVIIVGFALNVPAFRAVSGWASTSAVVLCMGGLQLTGLWLMGQYIGRTYDEVKRRPHYIIADAVGLDVAVATDSSRQTRRILRNDTPRHTTTSIRAAQPDLETCEPS